MFLSASVGVFSSTRITRDHNAREPAELLLLQQNHPNEPNIVVCKNPHACYVKGRLQLTRSLGDAYLKHAEFNGSPDKHRSVGLVYLSVFLM
jgi:pyruvate dehydrogenase phosphatase